MIIKALVSGYKLVNESCWRLEFEHGWTICLKVFASSCISRLDIDGLES
jgi:hypothetical protein